MCVPRLCACVLCRFHIFSYPLTLMPAVTRAQSLFEDVQPAAIFQHLSEILTFTVSAADSRVSITTTDGRFSTNNSKTSFGQQVFPHEYDPPGGTPGPRPSENHSIVVTHADFFFFFFYQSASAFNVFASKIELPLIFSPLLFSTHPHRPAESQMTVNELPASSSLCLLPSLRWSAF